MGKFWKILDAITRIFPMLDTYLELQIEKLPMTKEFQEEKYKKKATKQKKKGVRAKFRLRTKEERTQKRKEKRGWQEPSA